ncbi:hypothetical protein B5V00_06945 [Geothermobacter hydrogeniphilus]|uniref:Uncharacterized protein n=1 Tax=Geothermobacter hydrogeniphilus TaxID=1969733 RepID=A0A1X0Y601_9BACT|nr:hypothetical protein B5V00_06945 [Geothermobacter hydrogeniphilus]
MPHSHCYEAAIEPKSGLKRSNFRFSLYSSTASWARNSRLRLRSEGQRRCSGRYPPDKRNFPGQ